MSETTPIRTSKDLVNCFDIQRTDEVKLENFIEDVEELQHKQSIPSYQEWRDNLMTEDINEIIESSPAVLLQMPQSKFTKTSMKSEKTAKTVTSAELVLRHSPQKIKNFAHMPLMSSASKSKIANKAKEMEQYSSNKQASVSKLKTNEASHLKRDSANTKSGSKIKTIQLETEVVGLQDFIKQVQDNKEAISSKKQKLRDLEEQIVSISDKMKTVFQTFGIEEMEQRVKELEDDYRLQKNDVFIPLVNGKSQVSNLQNIEEEEFKDYSPLKQLNPISSNSEKFQDLTDHEYVSTEELMALLRSGVDKRFKTFLDSCDKDIKIWKENARKEVEKFANYS